MSGFQEYGEYDALGLAELVEKKEVTPEELVEEAITRIDRINPQLNAVIRQLYTRARSQCKGELPSGPFRGVPFLLKDLHAELGGEILQWGSRMYRGWRPRENSELVNRFLAAGVVVVGKTNTPELGILPVTEPVEFGPARNPWDPTRTTGGSSGGSAAAVASRMVPFASGGDGGGSIRIPSSCCGLFGLKPTRGRTPAGPFETELWNGFAIEHVLTRSVRDSAAMLDATSGPFLGDTHYLPKPSTSFAGELGKDPGKLRVALGTEPLLPSRVHPDCVTAAEDTAELMRELGHEVVRARPRFDAQAFARNFLIVVSAQTAADIRRAEKRMGRKAELADFEKRTWLSARMGDSFTASEYCTAVSELQEMSREVHRFLEDFDVILNPTVSQPPQPHGFLDPPRPQQVLEEALLRLPVGRVVKKTPVFDQAAAEVFSFIPWTPVYNVGGQPSMSVPLFWNAHRLPVGSMFTAKFGDEATLFRLAAQLEEARPWIDRKPPVCS